MAKDNNPKKTAIRGAKQQRRLPPNPVCNACGESDPQQAGRATRTPA